MTNTLAYCTKELITAVKSFKKFYRKGLWLEVKKILKANLDFRFQRPILR